VRSASRLRNQLVHTSILARRDILMQLGWYDAHWLYVEDYDLWLRVLGLGYNIINIPQYMVVYRVRMWSTTGHKYHHMQWLTFLRLFHEKNLYKNIFEKGYFLTLRSILVIIPMRIIQYLK
jgi:amylovoran biosynthesis glycosyltransferase AmsE